MSILRYKRMLLADGGVARGGDGGGGSSAPSNPSPTNTTVQNTNIPAYAQPYVETMLGAAQQQIFNYDSSGNVTSMKPYTPYSNNPQDYIAGFSPLQQQAQSNVANMQTPGQYGTATDYATTSGLGALSTANSAAGYGGMGAQAGLAGMRQGMSYGQNATNPNAVAAYMNPYLQNALNPSLQLQNQQFGQINAQNQGQATQQGAFGGGRQAVMQGLNQQNQMLAQNQLVGNAYNQAYNTANQNMQNAASLGMQGTAQAIQGANTGLQGTAAQQAAYQQLGAQGANLSNIAGQQTQTALGINAAQEAAGSAQQAQQQNIINQQVQNYATAQQYPMMQLSNMSNLLRGLPMQSATTQTYQAAPSAVAQLGGLGATALGAYGAAGGFKSAKAGGLMKSYAAGGQVAFDVGGSVESDLYNMDDAHLIQEAKTSPSMEIRRDAAKILAERQMENRAVAGGVGATTGGMQMAGGGIVAFEEGGSAKERRSAAEAAVESALPEPTMPDDYSGSMTQFLSDPKTREKIKEREIALNAVQRNNPVYAQNTIAPSAMPSGSIFSAAPASAPVQTPTTAPVGSGPTFDPTAGNNPAVTSLSKPGLGGTPQARVNAPAQSNVPSGYEAEIKKRLGVIDEGLGNTKAQADLDALRKEIGGSKSDALWQALMMGGLKTMGSRSPWAGVAIGEGGAEGVKSYAEAAKGQREDQKLLVAQQSALDQAEYARKTGNLNALIAAQTRLDQIKQHAQTIGAQYAGINASKEATLEAAKQKTFGELYMKAFAANGGDDAAATITATKAMQMGTPANSPISAPKAGDIIQGWKFKGGNPKEKSNWEKA